MGKNPAFQFYVKDWLSDPALKQVEFSTKGIWIDLICFLWESSTRGELSGTHKNICRMIGCSEQEFDQFLSDAKVTLFCDISVTDNKKVTICNRRMARDEKEKKNNRLRQQKHREKKACNAEITPPSPSPSPSPSSKHKKSIKRKVFKKPSLEDVKKYCLERKNNVDPEKWMNHYISKGWMIGKNKMVDWKAAVRTWENEKDSAIVERPCILTEEQKIHMEKLESGNFQTTAIGNDN